MNYNKPLILSGLAATVLFTVVLLVTISPEETPTTTHHHAEHPASQDAGKALLKNQTEATHTANNLSPPNDSQDSISVRFNFDQFDQAFRALVGQHQSAPYDLFSQLYDPQSYIESLRELTVHHPSGPQEMTGPPLQTKPSPSLRIGTHIDPDTGELREVHNVNELPASLTLMLDIADNEYVQYMLVRWIDTDNNSVIGMEMVAGSGIGGSQIFTSQPIPRYEGSHYLVEVFDAGESLELIAASAIAIERLGRSIQPSNR